jgi:hypothetical protein
VICDGLNLFEELEEGGQVYFLPWGPKILLAALESCIAKQYTINISDGSNCSLSVDVVIPFLTVYQCNSFDGGFSDFDL